MTSPPLTTREYAYFWVTGPGTHQQVTERIGLEPSEAWNVGDEGPRGRARRFMGWRLSSGLDDKQPIDRHIHNLLLLLGERADELRALWVDYDLTLQCVGYYPASQHGAHFDREQIRQAAQLGLAIDLDFYFLDDHEHEV